MVFLNKRASDMLRRFVPCLAQRLEWRRPARQGGRPYRAGLLRIGPGSLGSLRRFFRFNRLKARFPARVPRRLIACFIGPHPVPDLRAVPAELVAAIEHGFLLVGLKRSNGFMDAQSHIFTPA